ncbi:MAG: response regulator, partial [Candidatus Thiodiazotropha sp. (ex Notomyrtea botanica)]|nr:response regulator [Candidatus Thiodiazotropha sp. (ex Notomyrtea botanica)]
PLHIQQMLMNLCINARDAIDVSGLIKIAVSSRKLNRESCNICGETAIGDWVSIRVEDTGQGIPEGLKDDIFQPFVTSKEVGEGSGMGLAVVSGIIRSYAGHMLVSSTPGQGSSFEILLPPADISLKKTAEYRTVLEPGVNLAGRTILVVDDEPQIQAYFEALLSDSKAEVICCDNGFQALGRLSKATERIDLVICDQSMPGMSGIEMVEQLRNLGSEVPVILCSGYGDALGDGLIASLNIGMLLHKPMKKNETLSAIQWLLQQKG